MSVTDTTSIIINQLQTLVAKVRVLSETVAVLKKTVETMKNQYLTPTELQAQTLRLLSASGGQCMKIEKEIKSTQNNLIQSMAKSNEQLNTSIEETMENTSTQMTYTKRDIRTTTSKMVDMKDSSQRINYMLRMNDLAQVSTKGTIPKCSNVTTAIYENKIYKLSKEWCAIIASNSISGKKCISLYTENKQSAIHVYYSDERFFYFYKKGEFKYDIKDDQITKSKGELHLEWKRLAGEVVDVPIGSIFSKTRNGKGAIFYIREAMIVIRLDSGDLIVLDALSNAVYVNARRLMY
ncbi:Uncharacterized protein QTN25_007439 [Entamoeba marina]